MAGVVPVIPTSGVSMVLHFIRYNSFSSFMLRLGVTSDRFGGPLRTILVPVPTTDMCSGSYVVLQSMIRLDPGLPNRCACPHREFWKRKRGLSKELPRLIVEEVGILHLWLLEGCWKALGETRSLAAHGVGGMPRLLPCGCGIDCLID